MKHANIAFFVPHAGCAHRCSFCDQTAASGRLQPPSPAEIAQTLTRAKRQLGALAGRAEIAFFGGSFTAVNPALRRSLLEAARPFVGPEGFAGIRVSTRPDAVDDTILDELVLYGVRAVELGAQSMNDEVLRRNRRGHTALDVAGASGRIRARGLSLGLQMMTGLPGDDAAGARRTAELLAALRPDTVRIYPALTLEGTEMAVWYRAGSYRPPTLGETIGLCAGLLRFFVDRGIPVIRLGLQDTPSLRGSLVAGPHHPALRELCESRLLLDSVRTQIREQAFPPGEIELCVRPDHHSKMAGQRRANLLELERAGYPARIHGDAGLGALQVRVRRNGL